MKNKEVLNILIADDELETREYLKCILERKGYSVVTAADGEEALKKLSEHNIQVAVCDIVMPKMDGIEFLKRAHKQNLVAEVIMVTGQSNLSRCLAAIEYGACSYLVKPLNIDELLTHIERARRNILEKADMVKTAFSVKQEK